MKSKIFVSLLVLSFLMVTTGFVSKAFAESPPNFPLCTALQGEVIASYTSGTHGVPGDATEYLGEDVVYKVNENQALQCLCTIDGQGIQTNWWRFESLFEDQIDILKSQGWIYIPDGSLWGLKAVPYFAKNAGYACRSPSQQQGGGGGGNAGGVGVSGGQGGQVLGVSAALASTGNSKFIIGAILGGVILVSSGLLIQIKLKR